jgi:hypothetical protein
MIHFLFLLLVVVLTISMHAAVRFVLEYRKYKRTVARYCEQSAIIQRTIFPHHHE